MNLEALMYRAIELSLLGRGLTYPNPIVGAVIADRSGEIVAEGLHQGLEHAEVLAMDQLKKKNFVGQDLTLFVTLEPCNHYGKTPPCSEAILAQGVALGINHVVYATTDSNHIAEGGAARLRDAGVKVTELDLAEARFANRDWLTKIRVGRPRITWKVATSLDGAIGAKDGTSKWITSDASRADVKRERSHADALLTGTGTVLADNPSMLGETRHPIRIIMGERAIPADHLVFSGDVETIRIESRDFAQLLDLCRERGFNRLFVEAGPTLGTALFNAGLIDEILHYQAPTILGSDRRFTAGIEVSNISEQIRLISEGIEELDGDIKRRLFIDNPMNREFSCSPA